MIKIHTKKMLKVLCWIPDAIKEKKYHKAILQGKFLLLSLMAEESGKKYIINKEAGLMENGGPTIKMNNRPNSEPSKPSSSLKENLHNLEKPDSRLGNGALPAGLARGVLDLSVPVLAAQHLPATVGRDSRSLAVDELQINPGDDMGFRLEEESSINETVLEVSRRDHTAVSLDVENLGSGRHSAVVFHKNLQIKENNSAQSPKNYDSALVLSSSSGKSFKHKGRSQAKKQAKLLHSSNTRFKISGAQRTPLKESMEHIAESISTLATPNSGVTISIGTDAQIGGEHAPGQ